MYFQPFLHVFFQNNTTSFIIFIVPEGITSYFDCMYLLNQLILNDYENCLDRIARSLTKVTQETSLVVLHLSSLPLLFLALCFLHISSPLLRQPPNMYFVAEVSHLLSPDILIYTIQTDMYFYDFLVILPSSLSLLHCEHVSLCSPESPHIIMRCFFPPFS